jgi:hypothetical protein
MTSDGSFDPYEKWLGIPRSQQPPDYYCLLGLNRFEEDRDEIQRRAEQRLRQVNTYRRGPHVRICDELIHKINVARTCLLNPSLKPSYDQKLRGSSAVASAAPRADDDDLGLAPEAGAAAAKPLSARSVPKPTRLDSLPDLVADPMALDNLFGPATSSSPVAVSSPSRPVSAPASDPLDLDSLFGPVVSPVPKPAAAAAPADSTVDPLDWVLDGQDVASLVEDPVEPEPVARVEPKKPAVAKSAAAKAAPIKPATSPRPASVNTSPAAKPRKAPAPATPSQGDSQVLAATTTISQATQVVPRKPATSPRPEEPAPAAQPPAEDPGYEVLEAGDDATAASDDDRYEVVVGGDEAESGAPGQAGQRLGVLWESLVAAVRKIDPRRPQGRLRFLIGALVLTVAGTLFYMAIPFWPKSQPAYSKPAPRPGSAQHRQPPAKASSQPAVAAPGPETAEAGAGDPRKPIEIGVAFGTEKRTWFDWAVQEFASRKEGAGIQVNLIPMGSEEAAHAILDGDRRIHVWSPASSLYGVIFRRDWEAKGRESPFARQEKLALTPMVIVMWKSRYQAFSRRCREISLQTLDFAMRAKGGWGQIAAKPQWGRFKFSHTHPNQSNSGLMTLLLLSYEYFHKTADLSVREIMTEDFQDYLEGFERGVTGMSDSTAGLTKLLSHSTGDLMKEMVLEGPSRYDAILVYESVAIDYLGSAEGRWEPLQVIYPPCNLWSENPYYILNTSWTTPAHQKAAETFLKFLLTEPSQVKALEHGFRPGNTAVTIKRPESPFVRYAANGLTIDVSPICEVPSPEVIDNLLESWIRNTAPAAR